LDVLLVDWWFVAAMAIGATLIAACFVGLLYAPKLRTLPGRNAVGFVCVLVGGLASLVVLLFITGRNGVSHSVPIYSPSGKMAARIEDVDEGATGGSTSVELYWASGFREQTVYEGAWKSVHSSDIQWKSNTELAIYYSTEYNSKYQCVQGTVVKVSCIAR
jgi:hypothetical protein